MLKFTGLLESRVTQKVTLCLLLPVASIQNIRHPISSVSPDSLSVASRAVHSG